MKTQGKAPVQMKESTSSASSPTRPGFATPAGLGNSGMAESAAIQDHAEEGVSGAGAAMPYADLIQRSFGRFDVSSVKVHTDNEAAATSRDLGAQAFTAGSDIAVGGSANLRLMAHEAAHVVQQQHGKGPAGGVSAAGDSFEAEADRVADAVVAGKSAEPIFEASLGKDSGGKAGKAVQKKAVQALHGDLNAQVLPEIAAKSPGLAGKTVGQAGAAISERDANFNPARKVEFEARLTAAILADPGPCLPIVNEVSRKMLAYFDAKVAAGVTKADEDLKKLGRNFAGLANKEDPSKEKANTVFFGRLANQTSGLKGDIASEMRGVLSGGGTIPQQIFAHHQFMDQIWDAKGAGDFKQAIPEQLRQKAAEKGEKLNANLQMIAPKHFRQEVPGTPGKERRQFAERGRFNPEDAGSRVKETFGQASVPTTGDASGIRARAVTGASSQGTGTQSAAVGGSTPATGLSGAQGGGQEHQRGVDRLTMDENNAFVQEARLLLDMPLAGGISGTTTDLMEIGTIFGVSDLHLYAIAVLGHLGSAGAHSFHEIAKAASFAGIPYRDGDYASFIPAVYMPRVQKLFTEFADVVNAPAKAAAPATASATPAAAPAKPSKPVT